MSLKINYLGGKCPVQSEGQFDEYSYYFRSRGQHWSIEVTDASDMTVLFELKVKYGDSDFAAGWMSENEAFQLIVSTYFKWKAGLLK